MRYIKVRDGEAERKAALVKSLNEAEDKPYLFDWLGLAFVVASVVFAMVIFK